MSNGQAHDFSGLAQVLNGYLNRNGMAHLLFEEKLRKNWGAVMGQRASEMTELESMQNWVLHVRVQNASWRMELHYQKENIRQKANTLLGREVVQDVLFM